MSHKEDGLCIFHDYIAEMISLLPQSMAVIAICGSSNTWLMTNLNTIVSIVFADSPVG